MAFFGGNYIKYNNCNTMQYFKATASVGYCSPHMKCTLDRIYFVSPTISCRPKLLKSKKSQYVDNLLSGYRLELDKTVGEPDIWLSHNQVRGVPAFWIHWCLAIHIRITIYYLCCNPLPYCDHNTDFTTSFYYFFY